MIPIIRNIHEGMTFAEELRHVVSVEPILDSVPPPAQPFGGSDEDWLNYDQAYEAWRLTRIPKRRDPGPVRVLEVWEGFDELLAICRAKDLFTRPMWTEMALAGSTDEEQLKRFIRIKVPLVPWAALWTQGTFFKLLVKLTPSIAYDAFSIGQDMILESRREICRALYDVGLKEIQAHLHIDTPYYQTAQTFNTEGLGVFTIEDQGRYFLSRRVFTERP